MRLRSAFQTAALAAILALPVAAAGQQAAPGGASAGQNAMARVEQRLSKLHDALGITPAEENLWTQYAQIQRTNASEMSQRLAQRRTGRNSMSATENIQSLADMSAQHARNMQRLSAAFERLYGAMPPDQRRTADQVFRTYGASGKR